MSDKAPVLEFRGVNVHYGPVHVLKDMDISIYQGELVCLLGGNASGKTTTLKAALGMVQPSSGDVAIDGEIVTGDTTAEIVKRGVTMVPENRRLFKRMTVKENLEIGAYLRTDRDSLDAEMEHIFEMFPRVKERLNQKAGTLSGGEQQMVAVGRALMAKPKVLLMDEPSMGLAPVLVQQNFDIIERINGEGVTVFMVEQNASLALQIAHHGYVLQTGRIVLSGPARELLADARIRDAYLGGDGAARTAS